ncbi:hypothetical protein ABEV34_19780 [Methylorubrum rhodesianum]|uniref:hypothetical protein n=1 Tax=Methylorubrum rhodesianum TaxID=29427 RepID=UPI003D26FBC9
MFANFATFLRAILAGIGHMASAVGDAWQSGVSRLATARAAAAAAAAEAAAMLWDDLVPARRAAKAAGKGAAAVGRGVTTVGAGTAIATGAAIEGVAGTVGRTLGALLPTAPVTAKAVADDAVGRDDSRNPIDVARSLAGDPIGTSALVSVMGVQISQAAASILREGELHDVHSDDLPPRVSAWLRDLTPAQLQVVAQTPGYGLVRHVDATGAADRIPGLPPVLSTVVRQARALALADAGPGPEAMEEMLRRARANLRGDRAEVAAMMRRAPPRLPPEADEPEAGGPVAPPRGPRPAPRPSFH